MKLRLKFFPALACLLLALSASAGRAQGPSVVTEEKVLAVIAAMDKAARAAKVDDIAAHLADDVRIKATIDVAGATQHVEYDRAEYIAETRRGFGKRLAYEFKRDKIEVTISKDGQSAVVNSELFEKLRRREGTFNSVASEIYVLKLRGGKLLVTSYYATVRVFV
ncbi:MAG TPA: hypothetical protein VGV38_08175 [Pyrinomonadaceae bacterium]|nr:hypothetical protein [Pyrinomonadaceae bacterium]